MDERERGRRGGRPDAELRSEVSPGTTRRPFEELAGDIGREIGVTGGMPDNWIVTGGTVPPVGPSGATDSGEEDLRGEHDAEAPQENEGRAER